MNKKLKIPKGIKAYGYTGVWSSNQVGWFAPRHIGGSRKYPDSPNIDKDNPDYEYLQGQRLFLCEITVIPILDKLGSPITKIVH
jgi:hypothetical protein